MFLNRDASSRGEYKKVRVKWYVYTEDASAGTDQRVGTPLHRRNHAHLILFLGGSHASALGWISAAGGVLIFGWSKDCKASEMRAFAANLSSLSFAVSVSGPMLIVSSPLTL